MKSSNTNRFSYQNPRSIKSHVNNALNDTQIKNDYDTKSSTLSKAALMLQSGKMSLCPENSNSSIFLS